MALAIVVNNGYGAVVPAPDPASRTAALWRILAPGVVLALLLAGCGEADDAAVVARQRSDVTVVATVFPLAWIAEQVAPDARVVSLASRATDPHDVELTPDDRQALASADAVLYVGDIDYQPQVEAAVAGGAVVALPLTEAADALLPIDDHTHGPERGSDGEAVDPHVWLDPRTLAEYAHDLAAALGDAEPDRAGAYERNAAAVADELIRLDEDIDRILSDCEFDEAIVSHEAYAYLLRRRGLSQHGISPAAGHGGASPQRLAELTDEIHERGFGAVLAEPQEGRADAEALAAEAGVDLLEINPLGSVTEEEAARGYPALLRAQAETFAEALRCRGEGAR